VLWGDSYAAAWSPVFLKIAHDHRLRVIVFSNGGCPPLIQTRRIDADANHTRCSAFGNGEIFLRAIGELRPTHLFLIGFWSLYTQPNQIQAQFDDGMTSDRSALERQLTRTLRSVPRNIPTTIFRATPVLATDPERALLRNVSAEPTIEDHIRRNAEANRAIDAAAGAVANVTVFDPIPRQCREKCEMIVDGTLMYADWAHLSARGAMLYYGTLAKSYF
jgi:hypothetical protein